MHDIDVDDMTTDDLHREVPLGEGYAPTCDIRWFCMPPVTVVDERQPVLAQRWASMYDGNADIWVVVPTSKLKRGHSGQT